MLGPSLRRGTMHRNQFQPSFKLKEKRRIGARVMKRYHRPVTPLASVLAHTAVGGPSKQRLSLTESEAGKWGLSQKVAGGLG